MATPLMWKCLELSNAFYQAALRYPFMLQADTQRQQFIVVKNSGTFLHLSIVCMVFILYSIFELEILVETVALQSIDISFPIVIIIVLTIGSKAIILSLIAIIMPNAETDAVSYFNRLINYKSHLIKFKLDMTKKSHAQSKKLSTVFLIKQEYSRWRRGEKIDLNGLMTSILTVALILVGLTSPVIMIIEHIEPIYIIMAAHCPNLVQEHYVYYPCLILRYLILQWIYLEGVRVATIFLVPLLAVGTIYIEIMSDLRKRPLNYRTVLLYLEMHCIHQIGDEVVRRVTGSMMGIGFFLYVFGNWVIISGLGLLPFKLYCGVCAILVISYFVVLQTLPLAVKSNEIGLEIIANWHNELAIGNMNKRFYWTRMLKAQRPVAFFYAMTKYEKETKRNYYSTILSHTIDLILITKTP